MSRWTKKTLEIFAMGIDAYARSKSRVLTALVEEREGLVKVGMKQGLIGPGKRYFSKYTFLRELGREHSDAMRAEVMGLFEGDQAPPGNLEEYKELLTAWDKAGIFKWGKIEAISALTMLVNDFGDKLPHNKKYNAKGKYLRQKTSKERGVEFSYDVVKLYKFWEVKPPTVVMSYGLGRDSTAILLRWLDEPSSRDFDLEDLVVITAMTGDEYEDTRPLVEKHILTKLRQHGVRYVQVARRSLSLKGGARVLDDTTCPKHLFLDGAYRLSDELMSGGTVPQFGGQRKCSIKQKGESLDLVIAQLVGAKQPFRHIIGFNSNENRRVEKDKGFQTERKDSPIGKRKPEFPLVDWGWDYAKLTEYIEEMTGSDWVKSSCVYCPFTGGRATAIQRLADHPDAAIESLLMEYQSLALNPLQSLFSGKRLYDAMKVSNPQIIARFKERLSSIETWAIYRVRRGSHKVGAWRRSTRCVDKGSRSEMRVRLKEILGKLSKVSKQPFEVETDSVGIERLWISRRRPRSEKGETVYPNLEEVFVIAPSGIHFKESPTFDAFWKELRVAVKKAIAKDKKDAAKARAAAEKKAAQEKAAAEKAAKAGEE